MILKARKGLVARKKTVTRNGKQYTTTVWVRPEVGDNEQQLTLEGHKAEVKKVVSEYKALNDEYEKVWDDIERKDDQGVDTSKLRERANEIQHKVKLAGAKLKEMGVEAY